MMHKQKYHDAHNRGNAAARSLFLCVVHHLSRLRSHTQHRGDIALEISPPQTVASSRTVRCKYGGTRESRRSLYRCAHHHPIWLVHIQASAPIHCVIMVHWSTNRSLLVHCTHGGQGFHCNTTYRIDRIWVRW